jgi:hypothetical protein
MQLEYKRDFEEARQRVEAWWRGEALDRVPIKVMAPLERVASPPTPREDLHAWWTDPAFIIPRMEAHIAATYWGGEAVPVMFPVRVTMVAVLAAYLGCPYRFSGKVTAWADPIITDWDRPPALEFDAENEWWRRSAELLGAAAERAPGRYLVGLPDLNGPGEILALLRGTERLLFDLVDAPAPLGPALARINRAWYRYFEACLEVLRPHVPGSIFWMGIWSESPATDLQCDFSCMISPEMFADLFLPALREQTEWVDRTLYHLDGPNAVRHLEALLSLERLTGIQWVPGAGAARMSEWTDLLKRILDAGKRLYISCDPDEVEPLLKALPHRGLFLDTYAGSPRQADELVAAVARLCA